MLSIAVVTAPAPPQRRAITDALLAQLRADPRVRDLPAQDAAPGTVPLQVVRDTTRCEWDTVSRALQAHGDAERHPWHLMLQDDVSLCAGFIDSVQAVLRAMPVAEPVALHCMARRPIDAARAAGEPFCRVIGAWQAQAWVWPVALIEPFLTFVARHVDNRAFGCADDGRAAMWSIYQQVPWWTTAPSLVEHAGWQLSVVGSPARAFGRPRVAAWFIGEDACGADLDWTTRNAPLVRMRSRSHYEKYYRE